MEIDVDNTVLEPTLLFQREIAVMKSQRNYQLVEDVFHEEHDFQGNANPPIINLDHNVLLQNHDPAWNVAGSRWDKQSHN